MEHGNNFPLYSKVMSDIPVVLEYTYIHVYTSQVQNHACLLQLTTRMRFGCKMIGYTK